jgi:AraC-like DNA-binding protein/tetratricopeptide (TPR) repeat protein
MSDRPLPRDVRKAIDLLRGDVGRLWRADDLARLCGVARRTLEKHFRQFIGCAPLEYLAAERLDSARRKLLHAPPGTAVSEIATECGFNHFGRFALAYRDRYGESPSVTLRRSRIPIDGSAAAFRMPASLDRPTVAILPLDLIGPGAARACGLGDEIAAAFGRTGWVKLVPPPAGRYHLRGSVQDDGSGTLRVRTTLLDRSTARYLWADCWECAARDPFGSEDWLSRTIASALQSIVRDTETSRVIDKEQVQASAWELTMRALPMVLAADPSAHGIAAELLDQAIELAPRDAVPISLAAWCHGLRAGHHFTGAPASERRAALELATRASTLSAGDPLANAMLSAAYMLAHNLAAAETHARRALAADGGSAWGWGRLAWVHAYRGETTETIECCQIARVLAPGDPLGFVWSIGVAAANFELGRCDQAVRWYQRALAEQPKAIWINRFLASATALAGKKEEARHSLAILGRTFPDLTIAQVRTGLPHTPVLLDRLAEGLESIGMPIS